MTTLAPPRSRRLVAAVALVALVLGTSACDAGRPPAASVRGNDISAQRVDDLVAAITEVDPSLVERYEGQGERTYHTALGALLLSFLMDRVAAADEADDRGLEPVSADEARTSLESWLGGEEVGPKVIDTLPDGTREWLIELETKRLALQAELGADATAATDQTDEARALYESDPDAFAQTCLRFIAVLEDDLPDVQARLDAGEDFGEVSGDVSIDESLAETNGGDQCVSLSQYQQQMDPEMFADLSVAAEGDVLGPYPFQQEGEVYIIEVTGIDVPAFEDVADQIIASLPTDDGSAALDGLVTDILGGDDVRVDPRFGRWDDELGTVRPPPGALSSLDAG